MVKLTPVVLATILAGTLATPAVAAPKVNPKSPQETAAYWTAERMQNAKPRERARPGGGGGGGGGGDWSSYAVPLVGGAYAGSDRQIGKVFMTFGTSNYVCSGTAVTSTTTGVSLVWTAGHCVTDGAAASQFAKNFMFVPGYYNGARPNGTWAATVLDSTPGWEGQGGDAFRHDVGAARVVNSANPSATLAGTVGTRGISFGVNPVGKRLVAIGYPAAGKFNGQTQNACASPFRAWDGTANLDPMQISCDMTGGSSGGGWFLDANTNNSADAGEVLVSNTSYGYQGLKNALFGPYLASGGQAQALYNALD